MYARWALCQLGYIPQKSCWNRSKCPIYFPSPISSLFSYKHTFYISSGSFAGIVSLGVEIFYCVLPKDVFAHDCRTLTKSGHQHEPGPLPNPHFEVTSCQMFQSGHVYGVWFWVSDSIQSGISYKIVAFLKCHPYWNSFSAFHCWWWHFIGCQLVSFIKNPQLDVCLAFAHLDGSCLSGREILLQTAPCPGNIFSGFLLFD